MIIILLSLKIFIILDAQRMVNQQDLAYQQQAALYQSQMLKRQLLDQTHKRMENVRIPVGHLNYVFNFVIVLFIFLGS